VDEVIALEARIRKTLQFMIARAQAKGETGTSDVMVLDGAALLAGKATVCTGSRLARLRIVADGLDKSIGEL
jgi:hypothetical protein